MDYKQSITRFCEYQERSHQDVRKKLRELGCNQQVSEELIAALIAENLLNEERFAKAFARGKSRIKNWGRIKIIQELKKRQISDYCIKIALQEIEPEDYLEQLKTVARKKWELLMRSPGTKEIHYQKLFRFLLQKGYEPEQIRSLLVQMNIG